MCGFLSEIEQKRRGKGKKCGSRWGQRTDRRVTRVEIFYGTSGTRWEMRGRKKLGVRYHALNCDIRFTHTNTHTYVHTHVTHVNPCPTHSSPSLLPFRPREDSGRPCRDILETRRHRSPNHEGQRGALSLRTDSPRTTTLD